MFSEMEEEIQTDAQDTFGQKQQNFNEKIKLLEKGDINSMLTGEIYFSGEKQ